MTDRTGNWSDLKVCLADAHLRWSKFSPLDFRLPFLLSFHVGESCIVILQIYNLIMSTHCSTPNLGLHIHLVFLSDLVLYLGFPFLLGLRRCRFWTLAMVLPPVPDRTHFRGPASGGNAGLPHREERSGPTEPRRRLYGTLQSPLSLRRDLGFYNISLLLRSANALHDRLARP